MGLLSNLFQGGNARPHTVSRMFPAPKVHPFGFDVKECYFERYTPRPTVWDGIIYWLSEENQQLIDKSVECARSVAECAAKGIRESANAFTMNASYIKKPHSAKDANNYGIRSHSVTVSTDAYTKKGNSRKYPLQITVPCTVEAKTSRRSGGTSSYSKGTTVVMYFDWDGAIGKADVMGAPDFRTRWTAKFKNNSGQISLYRLDREKISADDFSVNKKRWDF